MKKLFKKHIFYVVFALIAIIIALGGITFAFFMSNTNQTTSNTMSSLDCVNVTFTAKTNSISLNNTYPMTDEEGAATSPYNFTIKNQLIPLLGINLKKKQKKYLKVYKSI